MNDADVFDQYFNSINYGRRLDLAAPQETVDFYGRYIGHAVRQWLQRHGPLQIFLKSTLIL